MLKVKVVSDYCTKGIRNASPTSTTAPPRVASLQKQETDEFAGRIIRCLLGTTDERNEGVASCIAPEELANFNFNSDGVLMRRDAAEPSAVDGRRRQERRQRLVLPQDLQSTVLRSAHDDAVRRWSHGLRVNAEELVQSPVVLQQQPLSQVDQA